MDLHRHDEYSSFDGFGKAADLARLAKSLGHSSLGISNHGNTNGLVQHYVGCKEAGIKPILGVEGYFLPAYKEQHRGYHLCLFAKNHTGYRNINILQSEGEKIKYYNPIWTFDMLRKYHEGIICTSACVAGFLAQMIKTGNKKMAVKFINTMVEIFGDDFYIEIQPYKASEAGLQEKINVVSIKLAQSLGVKCILTSDSHRGAKEDLPSYLKMHEIAAVNKKSTRFSLEEVKATYSERYMPTDSELAMRFCKMHRGDFGSNQCRKLSMDMLDNLTEIQEKVEWDIFKGLKQLLPQVHKNSDEIIRRKIMDGLKAKGKWTHKHPDNGLDYIERVKQEYDVIAELGFADYFLIVADYVNWSKDQGIVIGPGRGSVCNCLVAYALNITEVDSLMFGLDFRRFLRMDKKKLPDVDLDFEQTRRHETIKYILDKYPGKTARVASYGLYKVDNLINDLAKVCGLKTDKTVDSSIVTAHKAEIKNIKSLCNKYVSNDGSLDSEGLLRDSKAIEYNRTYDNIVIHFTKMYKKVRYIGTHAAGVAVTGGDIYDYTALKIDANGDAYSNYDLNDLDLINLVKFDCLGLITIEELGELRAVTGEIPDYDKITQDSEVIAAFGNGNSQGVFQFDNRSVRDMLVNIECDCFNDVIAANAMNRPGPLKSGMPDKYMAGKSGIIDMGDTDMLREYTEESYGTVIYQEQVQQICVNVGNMEWTDADKVMKMDVDKANAAATKANKEKNELKKKFIEGAVCNGMTEEAAESAFEAMMVYSFNKGHATGYSLISAEEMFYKVHYPTEFWFCKIKYAPNKEVYDKYCSYAVKSGCVVFLPHINYSEMKMSMRKVDGEYCLQQGLSEVLGVGEKAGLEIYEERKRNGVFRSFDDFYDRCKSRVVNKRVIETLQANGNAQFDKNIYLRKVTAYNTALLMRAEK